MLHVNLTFVVFLFFCTNCTCSICKFTRCWCIARANRAENKRHCKSWVYKKHHPNRNLKNIRVFSILANYLFNQGIYGKSCSMFHLFKKKALSQILAFHPYSMIVSCLFCSSFAFSMLLCNFPSLKLWICLLDQSWGQDAWIIVQILFFAVIGVERNLRCIKTR